MVNLEETNYRNQSTVNVYMKFRIYLTTIDKTVKFNCDMGMLLRPNRSQMLVPCRPVVCA